MSVDDNVVSLRLAPHYKSLSPIHTAHNTSLKLLRRLNFHVHNRLKNDRASLGVALPEGIPGHIQKSLVIRGSTKILLDQLLYYANIENNMGSVIFLQMNQA
jgi:hypothetical protein